MSGHFLSDNEVFPLDGFHCIQNDNMDIALYFRLLYGI